MAPALRFRGILPIAQTAAAAVFGGWGLWQRSAILSRPFLGGTLGDTTARFHVWPWPYKLAAVSNMPAALATALLSVPLESLRPGLSELALNTPSLPLIYVFWYWIGRRLDRRWKITDGAPWIGLAMFTAVSLIGAFIPHQYGGVTVYLPFGIAVWTVVIAVLLFLTKSSAAAKG